MSFDTEVLIIGAGMLGLGLAVQLIRKFGVNSFEIIEKPNDVRGTWLANTYLRCGCDVPIFLDTICSSIAPSPNNIMSYLISNSILQ